MPTIRFSGLASGIDADAVIQAMTDAKRVQSDRLELQVSERERETDSLEEVNTRLLAVQDTLNDFLALAGGSISKRATSSNTDAVDVSVSTNAPTSSTTISSVSQLARAATFSFDDRFTAADEPLAPGLAGTSNITIEMGSGASQQTYDISIDSSTTLADLASSINETTQESVIASVVNLGTEDNPEYTLLMNGQRSGTEEGTLNVVIPTEVTDEGIFGSYSLEQAQNAVFSIAGLGQITRQSNQVGSLIPGMNFELKSVSASPVTITVSNDAESTADKVEAFIETFNDLHNYVDENNKVEQENLDESNTINIFGSLAKTRTDDQAINDIKNALASSFSNVDGSPVQVFPDIGITTARDGSLDFDRAKFVTSVSEDPLAVNSLLTDFSEDVAKTGGIISNYTQFNGLIDLAVRSNDTEIENINEKIERIEKSIQSEEDRLRLVFTNLESTTSRLNSGAQALAGILAGIG